MFDFDTKFDVIYADPPWTYGDKLKHHGGSADSHYDTMDIEDICNMKVSDIATDNAFLFLWGTWPLLPEAMRVIDSWGFTFKTCAFVWLKTYSTGKEVFGMGNYTRGNTEYCLLGVKGKPKRKSNLVSQVIKSVIKKHSQKPDVVRTKIVKLCGDVPRIELFARTKVFGWSTWGNDPNLNNPTLEEFPLT